MFKNIDFLLILWLYIVNKSDASGVILKRSYEGPSGEGRHLYIRRLPAVEEFQSDVYEVFAKPYGYHLQTITAISILKGEGESSVVGEIKFEQTPGGPVHIRGNITGLPEGKHGLHIHQSGDLRNGCTGLGGHFNPYMLQHGGPADPLRHVGDLGNIKVEGEGAIDINIVDGLVQLTGFPRGVVGRALVVTSDPDDYGRGGDAQSLLDGNSGKPLACGVIAYIRCEMLSQSDDELCTLLEIMKKAKIATNNLLPRKSRDRYEAIYQKFMN